MNSRSQPMPELGPGTGPPGPRTGVVVPEGRFAPRAAGGNVENKHRLKLDIKIRLESRLFQTLFKKSNYLFFDCVTIVVLYKITK